LTYYLDLLDKSAGPWATETEGKIHTI
jgi:hypothetical protein